MEDKKILVTDDNGKNRKLIRVILEKAGYEVTEAENGEEAVRLSTEGEYSLILMDYRMPILDGIEATRIIKSDSRTSDVPVFIVTSSAMPRDRERIMEASGCDMLFIKPINYHEILDEVGKVLNR